MTSLALTLLFVLASSKQSAPHAPATSNSQNANAAAKAQANTTSNNQPSSVAAKDQNYEAALTSAINDLRAFISANKQNKAAAHTATANGFPVGTSSVTDFGAVGDGLTDDTAALQLAFASQNGHSTTLFCPPGNYRITKTLEFRGEVSNGFKFEGAQGATHDLLGCRIFWDGEAGGVLLHTLGLNGSVIRDVSFDGNYKARYVVWLDSDNHPGSWGITLERVGVGRVFDDDSAAIALSHPDPSGTKQLDQIDIYSPLIMNDGDKPRGVGIKYLQGGNAKNLTLIGGSIMNFRTGIQYADQGGASSVVEGVTFLNNSSEDLILKAGNYAISGVRSEGSGAFIRGGICTATGGVSVVGSYWAGPAATDDDVVIDFHGPLKLDTVALYNQRTPTSLPMVKVARPSMAGGPISGNCASPTHVVSFNNFYLNADAKHSPFTDGTYDLLHSSAPRSMLAPARQSSILSWGDTGGTFGSMVYLTPDNPPQQ